MKKFLLLSAFAIACITVNATIRTVSNFPANVAQFATVDAAIGASAAGDTILVHGSTTAYSAFSVDRKLTIIGPGWSPNKQLGFTAIVNGMSFTAGGTGTEIQGLIFDGNLTLINGFSLNDIRFIRNKFQSVLLNWNDGSSCSNWVFEGNWFSLSFLFGRGTHQYSNFLIQNNIFFGAGVTGFAKSTNILFNHNLFYGGNNLVFTADQGNNNFLSLTNNIFVGKEVGAIFNSTFNSNITFNCVNNAPWNTNGNMNSANSNIENQDPQMADQSVVNAGTNNPLANFTIAAGPANSTGSDGKDRGLLFDATGSLNWINSRMARLPFINIMDIINPTLAPGGNVQVTVEAKTNN